MLIIRHRHIVLCMIISGTLTVPWAAVAATPDRGQTKTEREDAQNAKGTAGNHKSTDKVHRPSDCEDIKAGTPDTRSETAAQKDCQASQHLGGGTGTSSGTGSGKMAPGGGSR